MSSHRTRHGHVYDRHENNGVSKLGQRAPLKRIDPNTQSFRKSSNEIIECVPAKRITRSSTKNGKVSSVSTQRRFSPYTTGRENTRIKEEDKTMTGPFQRDQLTLEDFQPKPAHQHVVYLESASTRHSNTTPSICQIRFQPKYTLPTMHENGTREYQPTHVCQCSKHEVIHCERKTHMDNYLATMSAPPVLKPSTRSKYPRVANPAIPRICNGLRAVIPVATIPQVPRPRRPLMTMQDTSMTTHACDLESVSPMADSKEITGHNPGNLKQHIFDIKDRGPDVQGTRNLEISDQMIQSPPTLLMYQSQIERESQIAFQSRMPLQFENSRQSKMPQDESPSHPLWDDRVKMLRRAAISASSKHTYLDYQFYRSEPSYDDDWLLSDDMHESNLPTSHRSNITRFAFRQKQMKNTGSSIFRSHHGNLMVSYTTGINNSVGMNVATHDEYRADYYHNMCKLERLYKPSPNYIQRMREFKNSEKAVSVHTRHVVVDWMLEVLDELKNLSPESFHLAVSYMDRYLGCKADRKFIITKEKMQEVGITAFSLASKYIDYLPPRIRELADMTDHQARKSQILERERDFLKELTCELSAPTPYHFLLELLSSMDLTARKYRASRRTSLYLCDLVRLDYSMLCFKNSIIGVSCLFLALVAYGHGDIYQSSQARPFCHIDASSEDVVTCTAAIHKFLMHGQWDHSETPYNTSTRWRKTSLTLRETSMLNMDGYFEQELKSLGARW